MAHFGANQLGNELRQTDEYGNPVQHATGGGYGGPHTGTDHHHGAPVTGVTQHRRSGSSSSSSSEDDGEGGRRKKGIKDKLKEKLPGGHKGNQPQPAAGYGGGFGHTDNQPQHGAGYGGGYGHTDNQPQHGAGYGGGYGHTDNQPQHGAGYGAQPEPEKKGIMDKIKDKLPGGHHN